MAAYSATVAARRSPGEVFDYLADFRSIAEWDPSIAESIQISAGSAVQIGARFRVTTRTAGVMMLDYQTVALQRPSRIVLRGESNSLISVDTIAIAADEAGGSTVTYTAKVELKGVRRLADPLLELSLRRLGNRARDGLAAKLCEEPVGVGSPATGSEVKRPCGRPGDGLRVAGGS